MEGPQRKAQQLLDMADAVEQSNRHRKNIVNEMNEQRLAIIEDFENSFASVDPGTISISAVETTSPESAKSKVKMGKNSKTKVIASLKQQLRDCQNALVEIKENAALKQIKLEMEYEDLIESYTKLEAAKDQTQRENEALKRKLASAVGDIHVERLAELESAQAKLEMEVERVKLERDKAKKETGELRSLCCEPCQSKMNIPAEEPTPSLMRSVWSLFQLDEEARATEETSKVVAIGDGAYQQPPKKIVIIRTEEPQYIDDNLESPHLINDNEKKTAAIEKPQRTTSGDDLEITKKKMKNDIEKMHNEWKQPRKKRVDTHREQHELRNKRSEQTKSARNTLESFFSHATAGLEDEEMEEEMSLFSLQRQCRSLPAMPKVKKTERVRKNSGTHSTVNESVIEKVRNVNASDQSSSKRKASASGPAISYDEPDRRQSLMTVTALSFRGSIVSLVEKEKDVPRNSFDWRLDNLGAKSSRANVSPNKPCKTSPRTKVEKCTTVQDVNPSDDPSNDDEASASRPTISNGKPDRRQSLMAMAALSFRDSFATFVEEEEDVPRKSFDWRLDNLGAKSSRANVSPNKPSTISPRTKVEKCTTVQDVNLCNDPLNDDEASASGPTISYGKPDRRQSLMAMSVLSVRDSIANLMEAGEPVPRKSFDRRLDNRHAKSTRLNVSWKKPNKTNLRTNVEHKKSRSVRCEDSSKEQDKVHQKIRKEIEDWAALDLAPVSALDIKPRTVHAVSDQI